MASVLTGRLGFALCAVVLLSGCAAGSATVTAPAATSSSTPSVPSPVASSPGTSPASPPAPTPATLLKAASGGDGDSWRDTDGREYRLGLVNTPETGECYGAEATRRRQELTSQGFRAQVYETDRFGRGVSVVTTSDGLRLNVYLARYGFADDRFLGEFRHENRTLAEELDEAFAAAKSEGRGLWSACSQSVDVPPVAPAAAAPVDGRADGCHPGYVTCVRVRGDGSGRGGANDLDCADIGYRVQVRQVGVDPYRLDRNSDGFGCEG